MAQDTDWMRGFIVRQDIPAFAVRKTQDAEGNDRTYLNFTLTKLREPDKAGNTHTLYCEQWDADSNQVVGDKVYIGKMKPVRQAPKDDLPTIAEQKQGGEFSDLPF